MRHGSIRHPKLNDVEKSRPKPVRPKPRDPAKPHRHDRSCIHNSRHSHQPPGSINVRRFRQTQSPPLLHFRVRFSPISLPIRWNMVATCACPILPWLCHCHFRSRRRSHHSRTVPQEARRTDLRFQRSNLRRQRSSTLPWRLNPLRHQRRFSNADQFRNFILGCWRGWRNNFSHRFAVATREQNKTRSSSSKQSRWK